MGRDLNPDEPAAEGGDDPLGADEALSMAQAWLLRGHELEADGQLADAIAAYDESRAFATDESVAATLSGRRAHAVAAMNRGNALQKFDDPEHLAAAIAAYDEAIAVLAMLPLESDPTLRNTCGAAWMNRGHAFQHRRDAASLAAAIASHERAIEVLKSLPEDGPAYFVRNLAGARVNLADALIDLKTPADWERARQAARAAIAAVAAREQANLEFADLGLKARRALVEATGHLLVTAGDDPAAAERLAAEVSDAIDDGLALARRWQSSGHIFVRPIAVRLFRFGAQLYRIQQPHFLAEFILENLAPEAFAGIPEFMAIANDAIAAALAELNQPRLLRFDDPESHRIANLAGELKSASRQIAAWADAVR